jgi:hypothetical protein
MAALPSDFEEAALRLIRAPDEVSRAAGEAAFLDAWHDLDQDEDGGDAAYTIASLAAERAEADARETLASMRTAIADFFRDGYTDLRTRVWSELRQHPATRKLPAMLGVEGDES